MPDAILVYVQGSAFGMVEGVEEEMDFVRHFWVDRDSNSMRIDAVRKCEKRCKELDQRPHLPEHWKVCIVSVENLSIIIHEERPQLIWPNGKPAKAEFDRSQEGWTFSG